MRCKFVWEKHCCPILGQSFLKGMPGVTQFYIHKGMEVELDPSLNPAYHLTLSHLVNYVVCVDSLEALVPLHTFRYLFLDHLFRCSKVIEIQGKDQK